MDVNPADRPFNFVVDLPPSGPLTYAHPKTDLKNPSGFFV